jgi:hypothetical protein
MKIGRPLTPPARRARPARSLRPEPAGRRARALGVVARDRRCRAESSPLRASDWRPPYRCMLNPSGRAPPGRRPDSIHGLARSPPGRCRRRARDTELQASRTTFPASAGPTVLHRLRTALSGTAKKTTSDRVAPQAGERRSNLTRPHNPFRIHIRSPYRWSAAHVPRFASTCPPSSQRLVRGSTRPSQRQTEHKRPGHVSPSSILRPLAADLAEDGVA